MMILVAVLALGMALVWYTSLQTQAAGNLNARQSAANAATAGVQHARAVLATIGSWGDGSGASPLAGWSDALDANAIPSATHPDRAGAILYDTRVAPPAALKGHCFTGSAATCAAGGQPLGSYTVRVRNDPAEINAGSYVVDTNGAVIVRVVGQDPSGTAQVVLEAAVARRAGPGASLDNFVWGRNVDTANSNSSVGSVRF